MKELPSLRALLFELEKLPGCGPRSARRLAEHFLRTVGSDVSKLSEALINLKKKISKCPLCFHFTEEENLCYFCQDETRKKDVLCVVEHPFDIFRIERCGHFKGLYHVLHGVISPLNNVQPKHLTLKQLEERVKKNKVKELILAVDSDLEGDTTSLYILQNFQFEGLKISRLARGIPTGSDLDFVDDKTLSQAFESRSVF